MAYIAVILTDGFDKVYEFTSEREAELLCFTDTTQVYNKPAWWDEVSAKGWEALSWALKGIGTARAKVWALEQAGGRYGR